MNQFITPILTLVLVYGYPIIILVILLGYLGLPIPVDITLLAAGSFSVDGNLNIFFLIILATLTAIIGDMSQFLLSKKYGQIIIKKTFLKKGLTPLRLKKMKLFLDKRGAWCIFLTRWLLSPLGVPINITAGLSHFSVKTFFISALLGEFLWACIYIGIGYLFGSNWSTIVDYIHNIPDFFALFGSGILLIYAAARIWSSRK